MRLGYDPNGQWMALCDGSEVLLHGGPDDGPLWRRTVDGPIAGVGVSLRGDVCVVTKDGVVHPFDVGGTPGPTAVFGPVTDVAFDGEAQPVLALADRVQYVSKEGMRAFDVAGARHVAVGDDELGIAAGAELTIAAFDGDDVRKVTLEGAITAIEWCAAGFWIAATGQRVWRVEKDGVHHLTNVPKDLGEVRGIACDEDGERIALWCGPSFVIAIAWPSRDTIGHLRWLDREVDGIAWGAHPWLGIALVGGDGNKVDVVSGRLMRTDTHPGRPHNRWLVMNGFGDKGDDEPPPKKEPPKAEPPAGPPGATKGAPPATTRNDVEPSGWPPAASPAAQPPSPPMIGRQNDAARIMAVVLVLAVVAFFVVSAILWIAGIL